jgi:hypothetical protein
MMLGDNNTISICKDQGKTLLFKGDIKVFFGHGKRCIFALVDLLFLNGF